jgi:hypothetical protein
VGDRPPATVDQGAADRRLPQRPDIQATMVIPRVSRADLADFMLDQLTSDTYLGKTPAIMY